MVFERKLNTNNKQQTGRTNNNPTQDARPDWWPAASKYFSEQNFLSGNKNSISEMVSPGCRIVFVWFYSQARDWWLPLWHHWSHNRICCLLFSHQVFIWNKSSLRLIVFCSFRLLVSLWRTHLIVVIRRHYDYRHKDEQFPPAWD